MAGDGPGFGQREETLARATKVNLYETDCGELQQLASNPRWAEFKVAKPTKVQDFIVYQVEGYSTDGSFSKNKRYSDFFMLRRCLS